MQEAAPPLLLEVLSADRESEGTLAVTLGLQNGGHLPEWTPGAHIDLHLPNGLLRQYSLCGPCDDRRAWKLVIQHERDGRGGSRFVHEQLRPGDILPATGPRNNFPLVDGDRYLFIAGGIGITPMLSMIAEASRSGRPWTLVYGGRSRQSMALLNALDVYDRGSIELVPQDEFGPIDLDRHLGSLEPNTQVYCCGPCGLIDAVEAACMLWPEVTLHRERFAPKDVQIFAGQAIADDGAFEVELACSARTISVSADQSLLDALEDAGYAITNSCRAGICGTCLVKVLDGEPDHRDDLLDDAQRASGTMILPCVSRAKTRRLVLEL